MSTPAQHVANAANAQLSTGPRTDEGKARSAQNARKHGLTARELIIRDDEREQFEALQTDLTAEIRPRGALEDIVFNQLVHAAWNLQRLRRLEAELFDGETDPLANPTHTETLDRYARYQVRLDRAFHRALRELRTLQTERALRRTLGARAEKLIPPLASTTVVAKQSQGVVSDEFTMAAKSLRREQEYFEAVVRGDIDPPPSMRQPPAAAAQTQSNVAA